MAEQRISHSGLVARSPEGHAAKGMQIKGQEDIWVEIQDHTFRNWVNEQLRPTGLSVRDLSTDLSDGVKLIALVEVLQKRKIRKIAKPLNQHHYLENTQNALNAITSDGIKLVNIGNEDIVNGNQKLILGLIWSLIAHYQIGRSRFPPKKLMLSWLKAVLPECRVKNFTSDWNSGINLSALLEYCKPGSFPHWRELDPREGVQNCRTAMEIARDDFKVPQVLDPEYLASPYLDELSGMTYLSYFMRDGGPGYKSTLKWVQNQIPQNNIKNFTTDWNSGVALCNLVKSLGGPVPGHNQLLPDPPMWESNLSLGMKGGERLGVEPILKPKDMADPHVDHLGPMSYIARYQWIPKRKSPANRLHVSATTNNVRVNKPLHFKIDFEDKDVDISEIKAVVNGPNGRVDCRLNFTGTGGTGSFIPVDVGMHELVVYCEDEIVSGCPLHVRALPDLSKIMLGGLDPCAIGSIVEVLINSNGAGGGNIDVTAYSPTDRSKMCPVSDEEGVYTATFQPDEAGQWRIAVKYDNEHIQGSPFTCFVYDPNAVKLYDAEAIVSGRLSSFTCDATRAGLGEVKLDIVHKGKSVHHQMLEGEMQGLYNISFVPPHSGKYKIYIYFNGLEVKGSPATLRVPDRSGSVSKLYYSTTETTSKKSSRHIETIEREREKMSPALGSHRSSSRSSDSRRDEKHYRQSAVTLNHERKSSDRSKHSEDDRRDSFGRRSKGSDIKISTEYINGMTVTRKDYENATQDSHMDNQFRVSVSEKRDTVNSHLQKSTPLQSPNVLRQLETPVRRSVSPLHLESPRQVSSTQLDSPRQFSSPGLDSPRQYSSPQLDSPRSPRIDSSRNYSSHFESSHHQYSTSQLDSPRQYHSPQLDSPRQYYSPQLDSPRQFNSSQLDSPRSPRNFESSHIDRPRSPRHFESLHVDRPRSPRHFESLHVDRPRSPRPFESSQVDRPRSPRHFESSHVDSSRHHNSHVESRQFSSHTETSRQFNSSSMLDSPRQYSSPQPSSPRLLHSPRLDSPRQQFGSSHLDSPHQYSTTSTQVETKHTSSHLDSPKQYAPLDAPRQIQTLEVSPGQDYKTHKETYERVEKRTTKAVITQSGNDVVDIGLHRNMGMLGSPNEVDGISGD